MQSVAAAAQVKADLESQRYSLHRADFFDTVALAARVLLPIIAKGVIFRRKVMLALAERMDLDRRAVREMQRIRAKYGDAPLVLCIPKRRIVFILNPRDVYRVLDGSPEPFAAATQEKTAALAHFEPKGVLISRGMERQERRGFNEAVLDTDKPVHRLGEKFLNVIGEEADRLSSSVLRAGSDLTWCVFSEAWFRVVRRIVFGDAAAEDNGLSKDMAALRSAANWAFLTPQRPKTRERVLRRIESADQGSLAAIMKQIPAGLSTEPAQQVPQWLFAFHAAGMATFRALALLASHREFAATVREEITAAPKSARSDLPLSRATVLESLRLRPTTLLLRETTREVEWESGSLPANSAVVIFTPFFHRDNEHLSYADRFTPSLWSSNNATDAQEGPLIPFSEGPVICPGRPLVLLLAPAMIAATLDHLRLRLRSPQFSRLDSLVPGTLNHFGIRFEVRARQLA